MNFRLLGVILLLANLSAAYKILFVLPVNVKSHFIFMESIINALLDRHHHVTCITNYNSTNSKPINYTELLIDSTQTNSFKTIEKKLFKADAKSLEALFMIPAFGKKRAELVLNSSNVQELLHQNVSKFDLIIVDEGQTESLLMFGHMFKAPIIMISTYGYANWFDEKFGLHTPWSHVPHMLLGSTDDMSYYERFENTVLSVANWAIYKFSHLPLQTNIAHKYFGHLGKLPSLEDLMKNVSAILINSHRTLLPPRPTMPGIVYVGGAHIKEPKPLPDDIKTFLDGATDGAIYVSFGTFFDPSKMPTERVDVFLNVFKQLKQRILWKCNNQSISNIELPNVMIRKWMPQNDVLAHPNVILFITHGGLFGRYESLYRGVPLITIPFYFDQFRNAELAQRGGYGKYLDFNKMNTDLLVESVQELITNKSYSNKAKEISEMFKDNAVHPLDEAVWWIEHVARFRGAKYLKSHAVNMSAISYYLIDIFSVIFIACALAFIVFFLITKSICKKEFRLLTKQRKVEPDRKSK